MRRMMLRSTTVQETILNQAVDAYSIYNLGLPFSNGNVVAVKELTNSTVQEFTVQQLFNGDVETFCGFGNGVIQYLINQIDGVTETVVQSTDATKPLIVENGKFLKFIKSTPNRNIRFFANKSVDTSNYTQVFFGANKSFQTNNKEFNGLTLAGSSIFLILPNINNNNLEVVTFNGSTVFELVTTLSTVNWRGINMISAGFDVNKVTAKLNQNIRQDSTPRVGYGVRNADLDLAGRNGGGADLDMYGFFRFATGITDNDLNDVYNVFRTKVPIRDVRFEASATVVTPDNDGCTGLTYDYDNNEILVANFKITTGGTNTIERFDTNFNFLGNFPVNTGTLQTIVYYNGLVYLTVDSPTLVGYDTNGVIQDTIVLPVTPKTTHNVTYFNGSFWVLNSALEVVEINAQTLSIVQTIPFASILSQHNIGTEEGISVNSNYIALGSENSFFIFERQNYLKIAHIPTPWGEGMCFDAEGDFYINRNEGYHSGMINGNRCWKYNII